MDISNCPCGSSIAYLRCCKRYLEDGDTVPNAEVLIRSRYTAYVLCKSAYLIATTHPRKRYLHNRKDIENWSLKNKWLKLEILESFETKVVFQAYFLDENLQSQIHHESSEFELVKGCWYYVEGEFL